MMRPEQLSRVTIKAEAGDAYDGIIRLATDAQRFGFALQSLAVEVHSDGAADLRMVVGIHGQVDRDQILRRFARHPTITVVEALDAPYQEVDFEVTVSG